MSDLSELYQEMILEHAKKPRNFGVLSGATCHAEGHNPLCGDAIEVKVLLKDGVVEDVRFTGQGCAISTASASVMTELAKGKSIEEVEALFENFHKAVTEGAEVKLPRKLSVFTGVKAYPMRVKCATLAWHTLHSALTGGKSTVTTE